MPLKCFKQKSQIIEFKWESMWLLHIKDSYTIDKQTGNKDNSCVCMLSQLSSVQLLETPWIVARQAPLSMGFSRQEYWSGVPCLLPGYLPNPGIEPACLMSPAQASEFFTSGAIWEARIL